MNKRIISFKAAFSGILTALKSERNLRLHFLAGAIALAMAFYFNVSINELSITLICVGCVISMELINTSIEKLCDFIHPEKNNSIRKIKDIAAAAVLISSLISLTVGLIIYLPKIFVELKW